MSKSWDKSILRKLKALMGRGLSAAEIGKKLGLSKNAIVGKMHRMGWNPKAVEDGKAVSEKSVAKSKVATKKPVAKKDTKVAPKKVAPKAPAKKITKKTSAVKAPTKKTPDVKTVAKKATVKKAEQKDKAKPVKKADAKKVKPVVKPVPKPEAKVEPAPKPVAVGRPIAGRGGAAHQRIVQHALEMANLKQNQCRWPIGDPDSEDFHFCGKPVFVGKPYCYEHCKMAYQFTPPKKR